VVDSSTANAHFASGGATICPDHERNIGLSILGSGVGTQMITASTALIRDPVEVRGGGEFAGAD